MTNQRIWVILVGPQGLTNLLLYVPCWHVCVCVSELVWKEHICMRVRGRRGRQNIGFVLESQSCYSALGFSHFLAHFILVFLFSLTDITNIRSGSVNNTLFFHSLCSLSCGFYHFGIRATFWRLWGPFCWSYYGEPDEWAGEKIRWYDAAFEGSTAWPAKGAISS